MMTKTSSFSKLLPNTGWVMTSTILLLVAGFVLNVFVGNIFGKEGLGIYSMLTTIYLAAGTIASFGIPAAMTKFTAEFPENSSTNKKHYSAAVILGLIFSIILTVSLIVCKETVAKALNSVELPPLLLITALALPFFVTNKIMLAKLRGQKHIRLFAIGESVRALLLILFTCGFVLFNRSLTASAWALGVTEFFLLAWLLLGSRSLRKLDLDDLGPHYRTLTRFGRQIIASRLFIELDSRFAVLLIGYFLTTADVGTFSVAFMATQILTVIPTAFQKVTGPIITRCFIAKNTTDLGFFINRSMQLTAFLLTVASIYLITLFPIVIELLFPRQPDFSEGYTATLILTVGLLFRGITGAVGSVFVSIGRPDIVMKTSPIRLLTNIVVSIALVGQLGINGVALGTTLSALVIFVLWTTLMPHYLGIKIDFTKLLLLPIGGLLTLTVIYALAPYIPLIFALFICTFVFSGVAMKFYRFANIIPKSGAI